MKLSIILFSFFSLIYSYEFQNFKLSPSLEERQKQVFSNANPRNLNEIYSSTDALSDQDIKNVLNLSKDLDDDIPRGTESNTIFNQIINFISKHYDSIINLKIGDLLKYKEEFDLGKYNFSGFDWNYLVGSIEIKGDRQVTKYALNPRLWVVTDTLEVKVDAKSTLELLKDAGLINIALDKLNAFAGLKFVRKYTYNHFADSYVGGLLSNFTKSFMAFLKFKGDNYTDFSTHDYLSREDSFKVNGGIDISTPTLYYLSIDGSFSASFEFLSKSTIEMIDNPINPNEKLLVTMEKSNTKSIDISASLKADLFELLKFTIFTYEFSYDYEEEYKTHLSFKDKDLASLTGDDPVSREITKLLRLGSVDYNILDPYLFAKEINAIETIKNQYDTQIWGGKHTGSAKQMTIKQNSKENFFYKSTDQLFIYTSNIIGQLLGKIPIFICSLLGIKSPGKYLHYEKSDMSIEYQLNPSQLDLDEDKIYVEDSSKFSIGFSWEYYAKKTVGKSSSKNGALDFLESYTKFPTEISTDLEKDVLKGPLLINVKSTLKKNAINYFNSLKLDDTYQYLGIICNYTYPTELKDSSYRKSHIHGYSLSSKVRCVHNLGEKYEAYTEELNNNSGMHLWKLKSFLYLLSKKLSNFDDLKFLFGNNIYSQGTFISKTIDDKDFRTYFNDGDDTSLGIIDDFLRTEGLRAATYIEE